jgi:hypothetical protein
MAAQAIAPSMSPIWTIRTIWFGMRSMRAATGQPAVHFPHW